MNAKLTFLGTGTSQGVPMIGCDCSVCKSADSRDKRYRSSAFVEYGVRPEQVRSVEIIPVRGRHFNLPVLGYRFGNIAYLTDMNFIPEEEFSKLSGLDHFIINCVRRGRHISHFSLEEAVEVAMKVGAKHSWLTHLSHQLPRYSDLCRELPDNIKPAYDGLVIG